MRTVFLFLAIANWACTARARRPVNLAALAASSLSIGCDWGQTRSAAVDRWSNGRYEVNPMLGRAPTSQAVDTYFAAAAALNALIWYVTPERWRAVVPAAVTVAQTNTVIGNVQNAGWCGL